MPRTWRPPGGWLPLATGVAAALLTLLRLATRPELFDRVWAEDGAVFLLDAQQAGPASLVMQYAGYGHLVSRLLTLAGAALSVEAFPVHVVGAVAVTVLLLAWFAATAAAALTSSRLAVVLAGLSPALAPTLGHEVIGNLSNLQWFLLAAPSGPSSPPPGPGCGGRRGGGRARRDHHPAGGSAAPRGAPAPRAPPRPTAGGVGRGRRPRVAGRRHGLGREPPGRLGEVREPLAPLLLHLTGPSAGPLLAATLLVSLAVPVAVVLVRHADLRRLQLSLLLSIALLGVVMNVYSDRLYGRYVAALLLLAVVAVACAAPRLSRPVWRCWASRRSAPWCWPSRPRTSGQQSFLEPAGGVGGGGLPGGARAATDPVESGRLGGDAHELPTVSRPDAPDVRYGPDARGHPQASTARRAPTPSASVSRLPSRPRPSRSGELAGPLSPVCTSWARPCSTGSSSGSSFS